MATGTFQNNTFRAGDKFKIGAICPLNGVVSANGKTITITVPTNKNFRVSFTKTITELTGYICGVQGIIDSANHPSYDSNWLVTGYNIGAFYKGTNIFILEISKTDNSAFSNAVGNTPVVFCGNIEITFS